jgi:hypothetical protein
MTKPGKDKVVELAKTAAKHYRVPLPKVAQIFQKHPLNEAGIKASIKEISDLHDAEVIKLLKGAGLW